MEIEFSILLRQLMESENINLIGLYEYLQNKGIKISYPTLSTYRKGNSVPSFRRAREIVNAFDYPISDEELQDMLTYSKESLHYQREDDSKYIQRSIRIKPEYYGNDITASSLQFIIRKRVTDLYGNEESLNHYFNDLIKKDLVSNGYISADSSDSAVEDSQ